MQELVEIERYPKLLVECKEEVKNQIVEKRFDAYHSSFSGSDDDDVRTSIGSDEASTKKVVHVIQAKAS